VAGYAVGGSDAGGQYAGLGAGAAGLVGQTLAQGFSREDENEADKLGFSFYIRAGWDPERFADFFKRMIDKGLDKGGGGSHPALAERVRNTEARVDRMSPDAERWRRRPILERGEFRAMQDRALAAGRNVPSDKTLAAAQLMLQAFPSCVSPDDQPDQKAPPGEADAYRRAAGGPGPSRPAPRRRVRR
jgi:predicted Zn-dependent protease